MGTSAVHWTIFLSRTLFLIDQSTQSHAKCVSNLTSNIRTFIFWIACEFAAMLLVLTLVYLFHSFQTHATPLTNLLAESSSNATVLTTSASICPADQRSIWDILWSCLATIFACSWVSIHPNIPGPNESGFRIFLHRLELVFWAAVSPELILAWAFRQWFGARRLEKIYKGELSSLAHLIYPQTNKS